MKKNIKTKRTFKERYQGKARRMIYRSGWALSDDSIVKLVNRFRKVYQYPIYTKHTVTRVNDDVYSLIVVGHDDKGEQFMVAAFKSRVFAIFKDSPFRKKRWLIGRKWGRGECQVVSLKECNSGYGYSKGSKGCLSFSFSFFILFCHQKENVFDFVYVLYILSQVNKILIK